MYSDLDLLTSVCVCVCVCVSMYGSRIYASIILFMWYKYYIILCSVVIHVCVAMTTLT